MLKRHFEIFYAAYKINTGFFVRSVGDYLLLNNEKLYVKKADFHEIFWCIDGKGSFVLDGRRYLLKPNQLWYYPSGSVHHVSCYGEHFHCRWLTLDGAEAQVLFDGLNLKPGINNSGTCSQHLFCNIMLNIEKNSPKAQLDNLASAFQILTLAASGSRLKESNIVDEAMSIIENNFRNPELNVERIAGLLNVNRSSLSRMFSASRKISIVEYLAGRRLQEALQLLRNSDMPICQIAEKCGYGSAGYFSKVIRRHTGDVPGKIRQLGGMDLNSEY